MNHTQTFRDGPRICLGELRLTPAEALKISNELREQALISATIYPQPSKEKATHAHTSRN